jgi:hypothetical protein
MGFINDTIRRIENRFRPEPVDNDAKDLIDPLFVRDIGPQFGITFRNEQYIEMGDGIMCCLYVSRYPQDPVPNWLADLCSFDNVITVLDIGTADIDSIKSKLNRSMEEQASRINNANSTKEVIDASALQEKLEGMYYEVSQMGSVMKLLNVRIYIPGRTIEEVQDQANFVVKSLSSAKYKAGIALDETKPDWLSLFLPMDRMNKTLYKRSGTAMLTDTLAGGNPFHFSKLMDTTGRYWGKTNVGAGGVVFWDLFMKSGRRLSYNLLLAGTMGSGKSTALKKLVMDRAPRQDYVRVFDVTGEFGTLVTTLGGTIVYLDGSGDSIINCLQILRSSDNDSTTYASHIAKVATFYKFLRPNARDEDILMLKRLLRKLYIECGITDRSGRLTRQLEAFSAKDFPIWSDMLALIRREIAAIASGKAEADIISAEDEDGVNQTVTRFTSKQRADILTRLEMSIDDLCKTYGNIFDGHTKINEVFKKQIISFNIQGLSSMEDNVFDAQLFLTLSLCWSNCVSSGARYKRLFEKGKIHSYEVRRSLILIDEAHKIINANKLTGVKQIETMEREARKYFGGIGLASQAISDFFPEDSSAQGISAIKNLFSFSTYKMMLRQDASNKKIIRDAFDGSFTEREIDNIPYLERGEVCMSIAGEKNITFQIDVTDQQLELFEGGL